MHLCCRLDVRIELRHFVEIQADRSFYKSSCQPVNKSVTSNSTNLLLRQIGFMPLWPDLLCSFNESINGFQNLPGSPRTAFPTSLRPGPNHALRQKHFDQPLCDTFPLVLLRNFFNHEEPLCDCAKRRSDGHVRCCFCHGCLSVARVKTISASDCRVSQISSTLQNLFLQVSALDFSTSAGA